MGRWTSPTQAAISCEVADRGREAHQLGCGGRVDDDLFPDGAPSLVTQVVALVQDCRGDVLRPLGEQQVPQDLGGHHQDGRPGVDFHVPGEDPHQVAAVLPDEVGVFLVAQRLEGGRVDDPALGGQGPVDRELGDQRLPGAGGGGHQDRLPAQDPADRLLLEGIQGKRIPLAKGLEQRLVFGGRGSGGGRLGTRRIHGRAGLRGRAPGRASAADSGGSLTRRPDGGVCGTPRAVRVPAGPTDRTSPLVPGAPRPPGQPGRSSR